MMFLYFSKFTILKFFFLKIVDFITICEHRENYFKEFNNFNCFDFLHFAQKFNSSVFLV